MGIQQNSRKSLRVPVSLDALCKLTNGNIVSVKIINLSRGGMFIKSSDSVGLTERLTVKLSLPHVADPICLQGEVVWDRSYLNKIDESETVHVVGVRFFSLAKRNRDLIENYILELLLSDNQVREQGIREIMSNIRALPPVIRLKSYNLLIKKDICSGKAA